MIPLSPGLVTVTLGGREALTSIRDCILYEDRYRRYGSLPKVEMFSCSVCIGLL